MVFVDFTLQDGGKKGFIVNLNDPLAAVTQAESWLGGQKTQGFVVIKLTEESLREMVEDQGRVALIRNLMRNRTQAITIRELRHELAR